MKKFLYLLTPAKVIVLALIIAAGMLLYSFTSCVASGDGEYLTIYDAAGNVVYKAVTIGKAHGSSNGIYSWTDKNGKHWSNMDFIISERKEKRDEESN